jgi:hypothetical protein
MEQPRAQLALCGITRRLLRLKRRDLRNQLGTQDGLRGRGAGGK